MSRSRKLILHIGFPKTGSSAIQAWLAKNAGALARHGIAYRGFREEAARDAITSGNGRLLLDFLRDGSAAPDRASVEFDRRFFPEYFAEHGTAIVSGEALARVPTPQLEWLRTRCRGHGISLSIVAYIRSVYDHCHSEYQQKVKRHGESGTFREYAAAYDNPQFRWCMSWHGAFADALKLRNYDAARNDLIPDFAQAAEIAHLGLPTRQDSVNRSLTFGELELLRRLNRYHGGILSRELSDALIYADPSAKPDYRFDREVARDFERRFAADVQRVNEIFFTGSAEPLRVARYPETQTRESEEPASPGSFEPIVETALKTLCEIAVDAKKRDAGLRSQLAIALARLALSSQKWDEAKRHLERALQMDPDNPNAHRLMRRVESVLANRADAT